MNQAVLRFRHDAMATTFEIAIAGQEPEYAESAAMAAFDELERLELELSRFIPSSDIFRINALGPRAPVRVGADTWECLKLAEAVWADTHGAFDPTIGALLECWRSAGDAEPAPEALGRAKALTGLNLVHLDEASMSVGLASEGVRLDLGGIGKGYALDRLAELLADWKVERTMLHAGQSTVLAKGRGWRAGLRGLPGIGELVLEGCALSGSGVELHGLHIIDPRTGRPVSDRLGAWALAPSAALADALSTAFMVMSVEEISSYCDRNRGVGCVLLERTTRGPVERRFGTLT